MAGWGLRTACLLLALAGPAAARQPEAPPTDLRRQAGPDIRGLEQAQRRADGVLVVTQRLSGTGRIDAAHVVIEGELSPGYSPGCLSFGGDVTFSFSATLISEIGGPAPCTDYDRIDVAGTLTLNSPTLQLILYGGYVPSWGDTFDIMNWGAISGTFGTIDTGAAVLPAPLNWDTSQLYVTGELRVGVIHYADGDLAPWNAPDSVINGADFMIALQLAAGSRGAGALQLAHGDMDGDGDVDLVDAGMIRPLVLP